MAGRPEEAIPTMPSLKRANLDRLRDLVKDYINKHQYESALFWADKLVSITKGELYDLFWYAQSLYLTGQYHRCSTLIKTHKLDKQYLVFRHLAAKCHYECREYQEALDILDNSSNNNISNNSKRTSLNFQLSMDVNPPLGVKNMESSVHLLRGKVYEAMDNRNLASECFREALRQDVYCYEAFELLVNHHMLTAQEERDLVNSLPVVDQCSEEEIELVQFIYENRLKKYDKPSDLVIPSNLDTLNDNLDVVVSLAERHYYNCDFRECFRITAVVLNKDPYNTRCLPLHIAVLVELNKSNTLFHLAHKLVDLYPDKAVAWFAVGCYYLLVGKHEPARRYLSKATSLDRVYGPAWLAFGHSFAAENEHDQAMAAYFTASQLMRGCHLPVLYIGLEYGLTNNSKLAERFFTQALTVAPEDPFVLHEMGVIAFQNQEYEVAERYFKDALDKVQAISREIITDKWEPLLNNLGHTCRKLKKYEEALEYHQQALILSPQNASTLSAIGYIHSLTGTCARAVDYFHKALGIRRDDTFSTTMLGHAIEELMGDMPPCEDVPDVLPPYEYSGKLEVSASKAEVTAGEEESVLESSALDSTVADDSSMMLEVDMEDAD